MSEDLFSDQRIKLDLRRCYECGRWWALEVYANSSHECPSCAGRTIARKNDEIAKLERRIRSLKGAATRRKRVK